MEEIKPTWGIVIKVWWSIVWRAGIIMGAVGFLIGFFGAIKGLSQPEIQFWAGLTTNILAIPVGIYLLKLVLNKKYKTFRVAIIREC